MAFSTFLVVSGKFNFPDVNLILKGANFRVWHHVGRQIVNGGLFVAVYEPRSEFDSFGKITIIVRG